MSNAIGSIALEFDKPNYVAGDWIQVTAQFQINQDIYVRSVRIRFQGFEQSSWTEANNEFSQNCIYFKDFITLFGTPRPKEDGFVFPRDETLDYKITPIVPFVDSNQNETQIIEKLANPEVFATPKNKLSDDTKLETKTINFVESTLPNRDTSTNESKSPTGTESASQETSGTIPKRRFSNWGRGDESLDSIKKIEPVDVKKSLLKAGQYSYKFTFKIPELSPSSTNQTPGINYKIIAYADDVLQSSIKSVNVIQRLPYLAPELIQALEIKESRSFLMSKGEMQITVKLPKSVFFKKEISPIDITVDNESNKSVDSITFEILQQFTQTAAKQSHSSFETLNQFDVKNSHVKSKTNNQTFHIELEIPEFQFPLKKRIKNTSSPICRLVTYKHFIKVLFPVTLGRDVELLIPITILEDPVCIHCAEFLTIFDVAKLTTVICTKCGKENSIPSELPQIQNSILDEEKTPLVAKIKESTKKIEKAFQKMTSKTGPPSSIEMSDTKPESKSRNNSEQQPVVTEISSKLDNPTPPIEPKKIQEPDPESPGLEKPTSTPITSSEPILPEIGIESQTEKQVAESLPQDLKPSEQKNEPFSQTQT